MSSKPAEYVDLLFARKASPVEITLIDKYMEEKDLSPEQVFETEEIKIDGENVYVSDSGNFYIVKKFISTISLSEGEVIVEPNDIPSCRDVRYRIILASCCPQHVI